MRWVALLALFMLPGLALADAPLTSPRPTPRPVLDAVPVSPAGIAALIRPRARPPAVVATPLAMASIVPVSSSLRPRARPVLQDVAAAPDLMPASASVAPPLIELPQKPRTRLFGRKPRAPSMAGAVCGDPVIRGSVMAPIRSATPGCGVAEPVSVTEVDGVRLSTPATMDCATAKALRSWIAKGLRPAFGRTQVTELRIAAHYTCRPRNNRTGAKISEHGKGKAIDISAFVLEGGQEVSVLKDYRGRAGKPIRAAHQAACGIFGTTLGPGSDGQHEDHLHFDSASGRSPYCR